MTDFIHIPVMLAEVLSALQPRTDGRYVDGTLGGAGHAAAILRASNPNGWLFGCDRDGVAVEVAKTRLAEFSGRWEIQRGTFDQLGKWLAPGSCDGVLFDLGVSSPQLDMAERGFSFQADGPLDMRMDTRQPVTAANIVNEWSADELMRIFREYGDEPQARRFARVITEDRPFTTTKQLADLIERVSPRAGRKAHPATKIFQALRIAVNDEIGCVERGLQAAFEVLKPGGRLAVITFHSLEDRTVKLWGREMARDYTFPGDVDVPELRQDCVPKMRWVSRKAILPGEQELAQNPRARSAQLRVLEKV
ncbi:MAG TPA: 16S rRNA (cytosine(1402)-N(4))-methyltransferase RsmH [Verrucomicrobiae bacterium]